MVPAHFAVAIAETIGHAQLRIIPRAAHALIYDESAAFNGAVVEFLDAVRSGLAPAAMDEGEDGERDEGITEEGVEDRDRRGTSVRSE